MARPLPSHPLPSLLPPLPHTIDPDKSIALAKGRRVCGSRLHHLELLGHDLKGDRVMKVWDKCSIIYKCGM